MKTNKKTMLAAMMLAEGYGVTDIASVIGRSRQQIYRWKSNKHFKKLVSGFVQEIYENISCNFREEIEDVVSNKSDGDNRYVYFILSSHSRKVKIGCSKNPERRLRGMQGHLPEQLVLLKKIRGGLDIEKELHDKFKHLCIRREWFEYTNELQEFISLLGTSLFSAAITREGQPTMIQLHLVEGDKHETAKRG